MRETGISFVRIGEFAWSRYEPRRGAFDWGWLDRAMDVLGNAGLKIVLGTPTCAPPKWLVDDNPDMIPVDQEGRKRGFGSRRHYTFSAQSYWIESRRIVETLSKRYGNHPALVGWQTDNEYGCHDTILSWSETDLKAFRHWLRRNYQSAEQLNEAWGNAFWSMDVNDFDDVVLPNLAVTETNPAARLDFWRFHSSQVAAYDAMQCAIIRSNSPGRWITHNFMGFFNEFDHWPLGEHLDLASWDSYPIGFTEKFPFPEDEKNKWAETAHPDIAPFHHDLYRGVGRGRFWVMEQQPGPVNWAPWNPVPKPGMVRLWTWEALAHGAEVVSYFRWRQAPFAQEQMHAGLNLPGLHELSVGGHEAKETAKELEALGKLPDTTPAKVAVVYDYEAYWMTHIQPQGVDFRYEEIAFRFYEAVRRLGLDVDFVPPGASLKGYKLVIVPPLPHVSESALQSFATTNATVLYGPRTGSKSRHLSIPEGLAPGPLRELLGIRVTQVASLRPNLVDGVKGKVNGGAAKWREYLDSNATVLARFDNGDPAFTAKNKHHYLACVPDEKLLFSVLAHVSKTAGLKTTKLPAHIRIRRRGKLTFAFNYGETSWSAPKGVKIVLGSRRIAPQSLSIWTV